MTLGLIAVVIGLTGLLACMPQAHALPSYARQTGQQCAACHNGFPELTPYGRLFKLNGYTFSGGTSNLSPVAAMMVASFTHTGKDQPGGAAPHYAANDNPAFELAGLFYGGAIAPHLGTFAQATYDNVARHLSWDNLDLRYAGATDLYDRELILGLSLNNNPTVTDPWNSTPAWGYPFLASPLAPAPGAATLIEGGLAQQVLGLSAYGFWNRLLYAEVGAYRTLGKRTDTALGATSDGTRIKGLAPYWRIAAERQWGRNTLEVGTFGLAAELNPMRTTGFGTDHVVDLGFDTQYQFLADRHRVSVEASWINENQTLTASQALGSASNSHNHLRSLHIKTSYFYKQTYGATVGYFRIDGSGDANLYGGLPSATNSPDSAGWIGELDFIPFNHGGPSFWPWLNVKFGLQYIYYDKFNGSGDNFDGMRRNARDDNTLYLFAWLAF